MGKVSICYQADDGDISYLPVMDGMDKEAWEVFKQLYPKWLEAMESIEKRWKE
jgi:hypothetical protein